MGVCVRLQRELPRSIVVARASPVARSEVQ